MTLPIPEYFHPRSLGFQTDRIEGVAVIRAIGGAEIAISSPPCLPERTGLIPPALSVLSLIKDSLKLLTAHIKCARLPAGHGERNGEEAKANCNAMAEINEVTGIDA